MLGAIAGDIIGSSYEWHSTKSLDFELFTPQSTPTDDTVLTIAVADCILHGKDYAVTFKEYGRRYPYAGYGGMFLKWLGSNSLTPYNSFGNGSAMRVSPVGFAFSNMDTVLQEAERSAAVTHNHPEGIKGAQAIATAIFLARSGDSKEQIRKCVEESFGYDLHQTLDEIRPWYRFDETCQGSVPQAIIAFLESADYEDAVRKAVSLGGDSDTLACMTGGIAQAYYDGIPDYIITNTRQLLDEKLKVVIDEFYERYGLVGG
ncbi:ADP-ribosylglycohydrolase family protein [Chloroflexota bacterium]